MKRKKVTIWVIVAVIALIAIYDIYASACGYQFTITGVVRDRSKLASIIPYMAGLVVGFWLGRAHERKHGKKAQQGSLPCSQSQ